MKLFKTKTAKRLTTLEAHLAVLAPAVSKLMQVVRQQESTIDHQCQLLDAIQGKVGINNSEDPESLDYQLETLWQATWPLGPKRFPSKDELK